MEKDKISPCLWFDANAEDAVRFYTGIFKNSGIDTITRYGEAGPGPKGTVMFITFHLNGQSFMALNGGPYFSFTPAISMHVACKSQDEIDDLWAKLSDGGEVEQCGWLKDKYGVSWQIDSAVLMEMMQDPDEEKVERVTRAMLEMVKLDIRQLEQAFKADGPEKSFPMTDFSSLKRPQHPMPDFVAQALGERNLMDDYCERPAYQQNDYISWIMRAKQQTTRQKRLRQMLDELTAGGIYMGMAHPPSRKA